MLIMKTNIDLIIEIRELTKQLPAKVHIGSSVFVNTKAKSAYISYYNSPVMVNWEPISISFSYNPSYQKETLKKLGISGIYRLTLRQSQITKLRTKNSQSLYSDFSRDTVFCLDEEGHMVKTIFLSHKEGKGMELVYDYIKEAEYKAEITDTDREYVQKSLTILRDRIKDYLEEISSPNKQ